MSVLDPKALAGLSRGCPHCGAEPGEPCVSAKDDQPRLTTHRERKPKELDA